ncbi:MAG: B12-binding domain-containing radical SAM protein [Chloroflexota bacterium]|nr:B12-binding domain-containing radical SAM protein [Chloroflexota bacterium]
MAPDILLSNSYFLSKDAAEQRAMRPYPPLGLLYLSAYLKQHGYGVQVLDNTFRPDELDFGQTLQATGAPIVGFHATVICRQMVSRLIRLAKEMGRTVIAGGPDPSISPEDYLTMGADYVVVGEGEYALAELMGVLTGRSRSEPTNIAGLVFRRDGSPVRTPPRRLSKDVDALPFPDRRAIDLQTYARPWRERHGVFAVHLMTSRGCPFGCKWCSRAPFGRTFRQRSPTLVAEEMRAIKDTYHPDLLWIADDILGVDKRWIAAWRREVERLDTAIPFECLSRADLIDEQLVRDFQALGCRRVYIGAESGSQKVLDAMNKGITVEDIHKAAGLLKRCGIERAFFMMLGYPGEEMTDVEKSLRLLQTLKPEYVGFSVAYPLRGTAFYEEVKDSIGMEQQWLESNENRPLHANAYSARFYQQTIHLANKRLQLGRQRPASPRFLVEAAKVGVLELHHRWLRSREQARSAAPAAQATPTPAAVRLPVMTRR